MVCPKCGRDCGSDAFCGSCGTRLEAAQPRKTGRLCPHCGGTEAVGNICAYCGLELTRQEAQPEETEESYEFPVGSFRTDGDTLQLGKDAFSITVNRGFFSVNTYRVLYSRLTALRLVLPRIGDMVNKGYLIFRWDEIKDIPQLDRLDCKADKYAIRVTVDNVEMVYLLCLYWKTLVPGLCVSVEHSEWTSEGLEQYYDQVDKDAYFEKYCPYRDRAADALAAELAIGYREARNVIDKAFDERQEKLYAAQPEFLLRDLNRVVEEFRLREEAKRQRKEERREKRRSRRR